MIQHYPESMNAISLDKAEERLKKIKKEFIEIKETEGEEAAEVYAAKKYDAAKHPEMKAMIAEETNLQLDALSEVERLTDDQAGAFLAKVLIESMSKPDIIVKDTPKGVITEKRYMQSTKIKAVETLHKILNTDGKGIKNQKTPMSEFSTEQLRDMLKKIDSIDEKLNDITDV